MATKTYEQMTEDFYNAFKDYKLGEKYDWTQSGKIERNGEIEEYFNWKNKNNEYVKIFLTKNGDIETISCFEVEDGAFDTNITKYSIENQFDCVKIYIDTIINLFLD